MFLTDEQYDAVTGMMIKKEKMPPMLCELSDWAEKQLGIRIYGYFCDMTGNKARRLVLVVYDIYEQEKLMNGLNLDAKIQEKIRVRFSELSEKYNTDTEYGRDSGLLVAYDTIADEIQKRTLKKVDGEIKAISHGDIWKIELISGSVHVFYYTDEQVACHERDGINDSLRMTCAEIVKRNDSFGSFGKGITCKFTSRQTLDEKFDGNMFYYSR